MKNALATVYSLEGLSFVVDVEVNEWSYINDGDAWICDRCGSCGGDCCGSPRMFRRNEEDFCLCQPCLCGRLEE